MNLKEKEEILKRLRSESEEERLQGLKMLGQAERELSLSPVMEVLGDESWRVRKEAVELFLRLPGAAEYAGEVIEFLHSQDNAGLRNAAVEILIGLGWQAVPLLLEEVTCSDQDVRKFALDILGEIGDDSSVPAMMGALDDEDANVRAAAAENLGKLRAAEAVPALLQAMETPDLLFRFTVLEALAQIGGKVPVGPLLRLREERLLRKALFDCLGRIGDAEAVPALLEGVSDDMRNVRQAAAVALARIAEDSPRQVGEALAGFSVPGLARSVGELLGPGDPAVRKAVIRILRWSEEKCHVERLLSLLDDEEVREGAAETLSAMGERAAVTMIDFWGEADGQSRVYIAYFLGEAACAAGRDLLFEALSSEEPSLRAVAAGSLGKLGDPSALSPLASALQDDSVDVREAALQALSLLCGRYGEEVAALLSPLLEAEDAEVRTRVLSILGRIEGSEVTRSLVFATKDESAQVRAAAVRGLEGRGQLQPLMLALIDEESEVRRLAAEVLGRSGDRQALRPLGTALADEDVWVRASSVRALGRLGGAEAEALVAGAMDDPVGLVVIAAMETLSEIDLESAYPHLVGALGHRDEEVVNGALQILTTGGRKDWIDPVRELLINHPSWEVRLAFVRALADLEKGRCRRSLEERLLIEGEDLVRAQIGELLSRLDSSEG